MAYVDPGSLTLLRLVKPSPIHRHVSLSSYTNSKEANILKFKGLSILKSSLFSLDGISRVGPWLRAGSASHLPGLFVLDKHVGEIVKVLVL